MRWLDGITHTMVMKLGKLWEMIRDRDHTIALISHASKVMLKILQTVGHDWVTKQQQQP